MPYAQNLLPRDPFPRGLGELAERAGGFGTWVVDMHWGLSPPFITGQNRPYGTPVVQTFYPRSQAPRLQNLQTGPVVAAGTWPDLLQADASPVFRTPVRRVGEQQLSLPPGAGVAGLAGGYSGTGYGHIPLGVAHPPTELYERSLFSRGTAGFGEEPTDGTLPDNLTVLGMNYQVSPEDWQGILANQAGLRRTLYSLYTIYAARLEQIEAYNFVLETFGPLYPDFYQRKAYAQRVAFGTPEGQALAMEQFGGLLKVREDLRGRVTADEVAAMPADIRGMYEQFVLEGAPALPVGYGVDPITAGVALLASLPTMVAWVVGGLAVIGALVGGVALYRWATGGLAEDRRAEAERDRAKTDRAVGEAHARAIDALTVAVRTAKTEGERVAAMNALANLTAARENMERKKAAVRSAGGGGTVALVVMGAALLAGLFMALRWSGRGKGSGSGGERRGREMTVPLRGGLPGVEQITQMLPRS